MKKTLLLLFSLFIAVALVACDDDSDDNSGDTTGQDSMGQDASGQDTTGTQLISCTDAFSACGGNPVGNWTVEGICDPNLNVEYCQDATYTLDLDRTTGTIDINEDGTHHRVYNYDFDYTTLFPNECLMGLACEDLPNMMQDVFTACTPQGEDQCACTGTVSETEDETGTWAVDGTQITIVEGDATDVVDFCINGDTGQSRDVDGVRVLWSR